MTRLLQRGSSTTRFAENGWSHDETPVILEANGTEEGESHGKDSLLILLTGVLKRGLSFQRSPQKAGEDEFSSAEMPEDNFCLRSLLGGSHSYKNFFTQLPEVSSLSFHTSHPNSSLGLPTPVQNKKVLSSPLAKIIMLSFISIFVLVAVLGSTSAGYSSNPASRFVYSSYRRLQEDFSSLDLLSGGIFGLGALHPKELMICPRDMEHHVPCYNASSTVKTRYSEEYERNCEPSEGRTLCLIRPPKNYTLPFQWPHSKSIVRVENAKIAHDFIEPKTERITLGEDKLLTFEAQETDEVERHFQRIANLLGMSDDRSFGKIGVRTVLDIGCSYGAFVAHLLFRDVMTFCVAPYESQNSHVQIALDRGLPAMIGSFVTKQLPYPASSFNMIHCADCEIDWSQKDGLLLLEIDRLLKTDGYFVWTRPAASHGEAYKDTSFEQNLRTIDEASRRMCWASFPSQDQVSVWRKSADRSCSAQSNTSLSICDDDKNANVVLYGSLRHCLDASKDGPSFSQQRLASLVSGFSSEELSEDSAAWLLTVKNYWSIITPLLFSDHPKRPAEDDPLPPSNIFRNVMDMNALYGGFNAALLEAGKSVWVMNVVPASGPNTLPIIYEHGLTGTLHDWCEAFPTYPRTYDLLHGIGLLSQQVNTGCSLSNLLLEMDRILRPEGWVLLRDSVELIEEARLAASQMRWEARTIEVDGNEDLRLLVCQKVFWKN
eukprot:c24944_g3_i2 orf=528-2675(+)